MLQQILLIFNIPGNETYTEHYYSFHLTKDGQTNKSKNMEILC